MVITVPLCPLFNIGMKKFYRIGECNESELYEEC